MATKVVLRSLSMGETQTLDLDRSNLLGPGEFSILDDSLDNVNMLLYVKDRYNISGDAYH